MAEGSKKPTYTEKELVARELYRRGLLSDKGAIETWCPHKPTSKQADFLALDALEALYGGAAGGGKSDALLMGALQYVDRPDFAALILRRTYKDLALPRAIMDRASGWLAGTAASWSAEAKTWTFPSGARITFGYLETENDKYRYQSSEFSYIAFDELTQFAESQYTYLLSRLRRVVGSTTPLRMRSATNPGGVGHHWVKARFIDQSTCRGTFVRALLEDNPHIDTDEYDATLSRLDRATYEQLRHGVWELDAGGMVYKWVRARNSAASLPELGHGMQWRSTIAIDFGASQKTPTTAFAVWRYCVDLAPVAYLVFCKKAAGLDVTAIAELTKKLMSDHPRHRIVGDQGALGAGYILEMQRRHKIPIIGAQKRDKLGYRKLMNGALERSEIMVLDCAETSDWIDEAQNLEWDELGLDDNGGYPNHATDSGLYGWRETMAFNHRPTIAGPRVGTAEYYIAEQDRLKKGAVRAVENKRMKKNQFNELIGGRNGRG